VLFLGSWLGQLFSQLSQVRSDQEMHSQAFAWAEFFPALLSGSFENWQSEWL
jgi:hypothetical protein